MTKITLTYNRSGGCWTICGYAKGKMLACKSHYGLKRQAQHYARRMEVILTVCAFAQALVQEAVPPGFMELAYPGSIVRVEA